MWLENPVFRRDLEKIAAAEFIPWDMLKNKTVLVTGATGLIGQNVVNALLYASRQKELGLTVLALVRSEKKGGEVFSAQLEGADDLRLIVGTVEVLPRIDGPIHYMIHGAGQTSSAAFIQKPVETINTAVMGTMSMLELARAKHADGMVYLSSMEVYGYPPRGCKVAEDHLSTISATETRSSYSLSKLQSENLCISYASEYKIPVSIVRLTQTFGPGVKYNDKRVFAEFIRCAAEKRDIVLKTDGKTERSYLYTADAVTALLTVLLSGKRGQAYNAADERTYCSIADMAQMVANDNGIQVLTEPDDNSVNGYLDTLYMDMDTSRLRELGWVSCVADEQPLLYMYRSTIGALVSGKADEPEKVETQAPEALPVEIVEEVHEDVAKPRAAAGTLRREEIKRKLKKFIIVKYRGDGVFHFFVRFPIPFNSRILYRVFSVTEPVVKNKVLFDNYMGKNFGCNLKYIAKKLQELYPDQYDIVWVVTKRTNEPESFPSYIRLVEESTAAAKKEFATAAVWVSNYHLMAMEKRGIYKREGQTFINTWHGSLGIKKLDGDVASFRENTDWFNLAKQSCGMVDYWISNAKWESNVYRSAFFHSQGEILEYGHPRNDIFFDQDLMMTAREKVANEYKIAGKKILLYAPTFRGDYRLDCYQLDYLELQRALQRQFGGEWTILVRLHPRMKKHETKLIPSMRNVVNATDYGDIQELLVSADCMITDYSSCIFDFLLTRRPGFIFATDAEEYDNERGFYYPLTATPFPVAYDVDELVNNIDSFDSEKYALKVEAFLKEKECVEDGHASERVVELIRRVTEAH